MQHPHENRGPSGNMELGCERLESASHDIHEYETTTLEAEGAKVILTITTRDSHDISGSSNSSTERYAISPGELAKLIKDNGEYIGSA